MHQRDRLCVLLMDEMSLKEAITYDHHNDRVLGLEDFGTSKSNGVANHVTVFMIRGLYKKLKQSFAYFFSMGTMKDDKPKSLMIDAIRKVNETGLKCVAVTCDQGANNQSVMKKLGVSVTNPTFTVDNSEIHAFFDTR